MSVKLTLPAKLVTFFNVNKWMSYLDAPVGKGMAMEAAPC